MTSDQLAAAVRNSKADALHHHRMLNDWAYRDRKNAEDRSYEEFCRIYGRPD